MTARPGWPAVSGAATFLDIRRAVESDVAHAADGSIRAGVYPTHTNAIVSSKATMAVDVGAFVAALNRNGLVRVANDGTVTVSISAAPGSGSRWSVVYVKQMESAAPMSDGSDGPVIDKVESTTSESAARALLPVGALELAVVQVPAGASATNSVGVIITQKAPYTSVLGGKVLVRNDVELQAWTPISGSKAYRIDTGVEYRRTGGVWKAWESEWISYTPTVTGYTGTAPTATGKYLYRNGRVLYFFSVAIASGTSLSGPVVSLPVAPSLPAAYYTFGGAHAAVRSSSSRYEGSLLANGSGASVILAIPSPPTADVAWSNTVPKTLSAGDTFESEFEYDPA